MPKDIPKKENGGSAVPLRASAQNSGGAMSKLRQSGVKLLQKTAQRLSMREEAVAASTSLHAKSGSSSTISDSSGASRERLENETAHSEAGKNGLQAPETGGAELKPHMESTKASKQPQEVKRTRKPHPEPKRPYQREKKVVPPSKLDSKKPVTQPNDVKKHQTSQQTESKKTGIPQPDGKRPAHSNAPARSASWDVSSPGPSGQPCSEDRQPSVERNTNAGTSGAAGSAAGLSRSVRPSAVRHRDRGAAKVSFSTCVEMLGPPGSGASAAAEAAEVIEASSASLQEEDDTSTSQAESLRKLEKENESLRHAIENYRELERKRNASLSENNPSSGSDAAGQEDALTANEEGEEDEIEKAIEVSPDGTFLKFSEEIGRGSFKTVYKGLDTTTGVFVAWCELQVVGARLSRKERDRFREEADLMKGLTHPNIVRFYDYWEADKPKKGCIVLVTELMTSGTLRTYLKNFGQKKVSLKIIKQWCRQILRGLQFLHSRNPPIIHRDLKCDNIFISGTTGQVKVGDLGLATLKNRSFAKSVIGTPEFMAPEVYEEHYDEAVDVYAFGMCMLEMVTAEYPYSECTGPAQIYKKVVAGIKPSSLEKVEDAQVRELIEWCTSLVSQQRPTVKQLLTHQFFAEDCGMRIDIANREETVGSDRNVVELQLRVLDAKKRRDTHKENEAIQFNYVLNKDNPEETAKQMVMSGLLAEENWRPVAKMIVTQIQSLVRAREEKRREQAAPGQTQSTPTATVAAAPAAHASVSLPTLAASPALTPQQQPPAPAAAAPPSAAHAQSLQQLSGSEAAVTAAAAEEKGSEPQQQAGAGTALPAEQVAAESAVSTESEPGLSEKKEKKGRARRRKTCERLPRLTVLEVKSRENGPVVSCLLETNQSQAITFKFDLREADVSAISYKMTELHLLPRDDAQYFEEQLRTVISQQLQAERSEQPAPPADDQCDVSGAGAAAPSSGGSPLRRPADLAAPAAGASQVPLPTASAAAPANEPAFPVLLRAGHGLQIVTLTPQQLSALLQRPPGPLPPVPAPSPALLAAAPAPPSAVVTSGPVQAAAAAVPAAAAAAGTALISSVPAAAPVTGVVSTPAPGPLQVTDTVPANLAPTHASGPGLHMPCQAVSAAVSAAAPHPAEAVPQPTTSGLAAASGAPCTLQAAAVAAPAAALVYQQPPSGPAETTVSPSCACPGLSPPAPSPQQPSALLQQARRQSRFIVSSVVESRPPPSPSSALHSPATEAVPFLLPAAAAAVVSVPPTQQAAVLSPASESSDPAQQSQLDSLLDGSDRAASQAPTLLLSAAATPSQMPTPLVSPVTEPPEMRLACGAGVCSVATSTPVSGAAVFKTPAARPPKTFKVTSANAALPFSFSTPSASPEGAAPVQNAVITPSAAPQPSVTGDKASGGGVSGISPHRTGAPAQLPNASQWTVLDGVSPRPQANGSVQHTVESRPAANSAEASVPDVSPLMPQAPSFNQLPSFISQNRESPTAVSGLATTVHQLSGVCQQPVHPTCLIPAPPQNNQSAAAAGSLVYVVDSSSLKSPVFADTQRTGDAHQAWAALNGASASGPAPAPTSSQSTLPGAAGQTSVSPASSVAAVPPLVSGGPAVANAASPSSSAPPTAGSALAQPPGVQGGVATGVSRVAVAGSEVPPTLPKSSPNSLGMSAPVGMVSSSEGLPSDTASVGADAKAPAGSGLTNGTTALHAPGSTATSQAATSATLQAPPVPTSGGVTPTGGVAVGRFTAAPATGPSRSLTSLLPAQAELVTSTGVATKQPVLLEGQSSVGNLAQLAEQLTKLTSQPAEVAPPSSAAADGTDSSRRVASAGSAATPSALPRAGDGSGASAARSAAEPGATPQSASDGSRPTSAADTPGGGGRKPPPLLLSDLAKELSKIHGKPHLPHVTSTPLLGALEDAAEPAAVSDTVGAPDTGRAPLQLPPTVQHGTTNGQIQQVHVPQQRPTDGQASQPAAAAVLPAQPVARPLTPAQAAPAAPLTVPPAAPLTVPPAAPLTVPVTAACLPTPAVAAPAQRPTGGLAAAPEDARAAAAGPPAAPLTGAAAAPAPAPDNAGSPVHRGRFAISPVSAPPPVGEGAAEAAETTAAPSASVSGALAAAAQASDAPADSHSLGEAAGSAYHQLLLAIEDTEQYKELLARQQADLAQLQRQQEIERELLRRELRHQQRSAARRRQKEDPAG